MADKELELTIDLEGTTDGLELFGPADQHLRYIRDEMQVGIAARDGQVVITGPEEPVRKTSKIIDRMEKKLRRRGHIDEEDVKNILTQITHDVRESSGSVSVYSKRGYIEAFTEGQHYYIRTMLANDLTFCIGPAGTGKTYLAVAVAVSMLKKKQVRKIVLARPAVEAGERLGFLPGDLQAKVNPYLRPLFDSLEDMMEFSQMKKFMDLDIIEVIPLAFMRGRTFNEAAVICDEAQNTLSSQMMMLLTRLGRESKMIITGDITQIDLERNQVSGLIDAMTTLKGVDGIGSVELGELDIVRHQLVQRIVKAYERKAKPRYTL